jgi:phage shock protein A
MNIWAKMITAINGGINEAGEAVIDTQALRILDQEIREAADELKSSKDSLVAIIAHQKVAEAKCHQIKEEITKYEGYVVSALDKKNETLALEVAEKIADIENQLANEKIGSDSYKSSADQLRFAIKQAEQNIKRIKQQADTVRATESVQRAQAAVAERHNGSNTKLRTAMDSLERIKEKQALKAAKFQAASEISIEHNDISLQEKLEKAGINNNSHKAEAVLARLKKKK